MNYGYGPQEMDTAQDLVVRAGRRADPPIHDAYGGIPPEFFATGINKLPGRWERCRNLKGKYIEVLMMNLVS